MSEDRKKRPASAGRDAFEATNDAFRTRLQRIEAETFSGKRNVDELVAELKQLEKPESEVRDG